MATNYALAAGIGQGAGGGAQAVNPMQMMLMAQQMQSNRLLMEDRLNAQREANALRQYLANPNIDLNTREGQLGMMRVAPNKAAPLIGAATTANREARTAEAQQAQTGKLAIETAGARIENLKRLAVIAAQGGAGARAAYMKAAAEAGVPVEESMLTPEYFGRVGALKTEIKTDREGNAWVITPERGIMAPILPNGQFGQAQKMPQATAGVVAPGPDPAAGVPSHPVAPARLAQMQRNSVAAGAGGLGAPPVAAPAAPPAAGALTPQAANALANPALVAMDQPPTNALAAPKFGARVKTPQEELEMKRQEAEMRAGIELRNAQALAAARRTPIQEEAARAKAVEDAKRQPIEEEAARARRIAEAKRAPIEEDARRAGAVAGATARSKQTAEQEKAERETSKGIELAVKEIEAATAKGGLLDKSTASYIGNLIDRTVATVGISTPGARAAAALAPVADLSLKMVPRFEGPQSDRDVTDYRNASGALADPTLPIETRRAAAKVVVKIMRARAGQFETRQSPVGTPPSAPASTAAAAPAGGVTISPETQKLLDKYK